MHFQQKTYRVFEGSASGRITTSDKTVSLGTKTAVEKGITPPVFASANTDEGDRANKAVIAEYRKRIRIL